MDTYSNYNAAVVLFAAFGSLFGGYSLAVIVSTLGQPTWYSSLNLEADSKAPGYEHTTTIIGAVNGVFFGAGVFGTLLSGWFGDKLGRVNSLRVAATVGIVGAILQTAAVNQGMYLLARIITGLSTGHFIAAMPIYYSEVAPPHSRGLMAGAHGSFINMGYALAGWVGYGCFHAIGSTFGWRFPNAVLVILGLCVLGGTFFVPESPRWLVERDRDDEALAILCKLHYDVADPGDHFARRELALIKRQRDVDAAAIKADGRWQLFSKPTYRRRTILAVLLLMGGQNVGVLVINNYNTLLYSSLGLTADQSLVVGAAYNTWAMIANFGGAFVSDRLGRRKLILVGYSGALVNFIIATGLIAKYSEDPSKSYAASAVTFLFLYVFFYGAFIDVNQYTIAAEIFPSHLRSRGTSLAFAGLFLVDTLWLDLAATASANIGWKYYLVFLCLGLVHLVHLFFKLPETSGLALEELDALFGKEAVGHINDQKVELVENEQINNPERDSHPAVAAKEP